MDIIYSNNLFRDLSMRHVIGYQSLSSAKKDLFDTVYNLHLSSMDPATRREHTDEHIHQVKWDPLSDCLIVTFKNGNRYKYWENKTWDKVHTPMSKSPLK